MSSRATADTGWVFSRQSLEGVCSEFGCPDISLCTALTVLPFHLGQVGGRKQAALTAVSVAR